MSTKNTSRILLIDDDASLAEAVKAVLESRGYDVIFIDDGEEALEAVVNGEYDLVLTDFRMPGLGGMEILERLHESNPELPVKGGLVSLNVEFKEAGPSSLDLEVIADMSGEMGSRYQSLKRRIQRLCVDVCNEHGFGIPFTQITLHQAV